MTHIFVEIEIILNGDKHFANGTIKVNNFDRWLKKYGTKNSGMFIEDNYYASCGDCYYTITKAEFSDDHVVFRCKDPDEDSDEDSDEEENSDVNSQNSDVEDSDEETSDTDVDDTYPIFDSVEKYLPYIQKRISKNVGKINPLHFSCMGRKICSCGCDPLHDGDGDYCNPFPKNCIRIK